MFVAYVLILFSRKASQSVSIALARSKAKYHGHNFKSVVWKIRVKVWQILKRYKLGSDSGVLVLEKDHRQS